MTQIESVKLKVLIADDEVEFASTIVSRLNLRNFTASMATSGKQALEAIKKAPPDVLLLDLKMPDLDGLEVLAALKKTTPDLAVIILTGHGSLEAGEMGKELGACDYVMKPVDLGVLIEKIEAEFRAVKENAPQT
jgi:DNA-binding response OmpR family regulator